MKRWLCSVLIGILLLCCTACNSDPVCSENSSASVSETEGKKFANAEEAYEYQLDTIRQTVDKTQLKEYWRYFYRDIDGNGVEELCITFEGSEFSIYTFINGTLTFVDTIDYYTGTLRIFASEKENYPGIFTFTCGNSAEHYGYLTIKDGKLHDEKIWQDRYIDTPDTREEIPFTTDSAMIEETKNLYHNNKDIELFDFNMK